MQFDQLKRREFITLLGGATAAWPLVASAQQPERMRRIGVFMGISDDAEGQTRVGAFRQGLHKLGWTEGRNLRIDYRWAGGNRERMRSYAAEFASLRPDVVLANGETVVAALQRETSTIPIVFVQVADPVAAGFVPGLARPGANITGFTQFEHGMGGKWLDILKEIAPRVVQVALVFDPDLPAHTWMRREIDAAAVSFKMRSTAASMRDGIEIERIIETFGREPNGGLVVLPSPLNTTHRELIVTLAARYRLPAVYPVRFWATSGGLLSYGADNIDLYGRAAAYVDRILRGDRAGDLPVQAPVKFELVINLTTAKALGLDVPPMLLARADEVIE